MVRSPVFSSVVLIGLAGCSTDLDVVRIPPGSANTPLVGDLSYYLPRTAITLAGSVTLADCKVGNPPVLDLTASITPVISTEPDPDFHYRIVYRADRSWKKEINYAIQNQGGTLQTFNGTINDQSGPIGVAAIGTVVAIGGAVALGGVGAPAAVAPLVVGAQALRAQTDALIVFEHNKPAPIDFCSPVRGELTKIGIYKKQLDQAKQMIAEGQNITAATQRLQVIQSNIDAQSKLAQLTRTFLIKWVPSAKHEVAGDPDRLVKTVDLRSLVGEWMSDEGQAWLNASTTDPSDARTNISKAFILTLRLHKYTVAPTLATSDAFDTNPSRNLDSPGGLLLRDPATSMLRVCGNIGTPTLSTKQNYCTTQEVAPGPVVETTEDIGSQMLVQLPQLGRVLVLPEHSGLFGNETLVATLNADGSILTIGYHSTSTAATGIAAVGTAATAASTAIAARNTAIAGANTATAAITTAKITQIGAPDTFNKDLADCLTQSATVVEAGGQPIPCQ